MKVELVTDSKDDEFISLYHKIVALASEIEKDDSPKYIIPSEYRNKKYKITLVDENEQ